MGGHRLNESDVAGTLSADPDVLTGIHERPQLYYALGAAICFEGVFSATYHVCPSPRFWGFDTTFMVISGMLFLVTLYHKRNPSGVNAIKMYGLALCVVVLVSVDIEPDEYSFFWPIVAPLFVAVAVIISANVYFGAKLWRCDLVAAYRVVAKVCGPERVNRQSTLVALGIFNLFNVAGLAYAVATNQDFGTVIVGVLILDLFLYICYYIAMKLLKGERVVWFVWLVVAAWVVNWGFAFYVFQLPNTNKFLTPAQSRALNTPCVVFDYWDTHSVWHGLSALGLFLTGVLVYAIDFDLRGVDRAHISVF